MSLGSQFHKVKQIGFVVPDAEKAANNFEKIFNRKPSGKGLTPDGDKRRYGKDSDFCAKLIFFELENVQIEFIQPLYGDSSWQLFLNKHGAGIHHILFNITDFKLVESEMRQLGVKLEQDGPSLNHPGARWGYYDCTELLGFIIEVCNPEEFGYSVDRTHE